LYFFGVRHVILALALAAGLVVAATASADSKTVRATLSGKCSEIHALDHNGATTSVTVTCATTVKCSCQGSTQLALNVKAVEPGTGADGKETGTLVASGPKGTVTLRLAGKHTSLGVGKGTWTLLRKSGYAGVQLARQGTYTTTQHTLSHLMGTPDSTVRIAATIECWNCSR
jgi:hypothetical protein